MERPINGVGWIIVDNDKPYVISTKIYPTYGEADKHAQGLENPYIAEVCTPQGYWKEENGE